MDVPKTVQKRAILIAYDQIEQIESTLKAIDDTKVDALQLSVLGKLEEPAMDSDFADSWNGLRKYCKEVLGLSTDFGMVSNPEVGTLFVAGVLAPTFVHDVEGKPLASMSTGVYGILRGMGVNEAEAIAQIDKLRKGGYGLLVRGDEFSIAILENSLGL